MVDLGCLFGGYPPKHHPIVPLTSTAPHLHTHVHPSKWHRAPQTHFPPRPCKTAWRSDSTYRNLYICWSDDKKFTSKGYPVLIKGFCKGKRKTLQSGVVFYFWTEFHKGFIQMFLKVSYATFRFWSSSLVSIFAGPPTWGTPYLKWHRSFFIREAMIGRVHYSNRWKRLQGLVPADSARAANVRFHCQKTWGLVICFNWALLTCRKTFPSSHTNQCRSLKFQNLF